MVEDGDDEESGHADGERREGAPHPDDATLRSVTGIAHSYPPSAMPGVFALPPNSGIHIGTRMTESL